MKPFIKKFEDVGVKDVVEVGGKNASLGEMIKHLAPKGVKLPGGFITTASAYRDFLKEAKVDGRSLKNFIKDAFDGLDTHNLKDLARRGNLVRKTIKQAKFPKELNKQIAKAYVEMEREYFSP